MVTFKYRFGIGHMCTLLIRKYWPSNVDCSFISDIGFFSLQQQVGFNANG